MIKVYKSDRGIILITTLVLSLVTLMLIAAVAKLILTGTQISGTIKKYTSALEASKGGIEDFVKSTTFLHKGNPSDGDYTCKLQNDTSKWPVSCGGYDKCSGCSADSILSCSCVIHSSPKDIIDYSDWSKSYGPYIVYGKIVDARGTSDGWLYTIDIVSKNPTTSEYAWISVLYFRK